MVRWLNKLTKSRWTKWTNHLAVTCPAMSSGPLSSQEGFLDVRHLPKAKDHIFGLKLGGIFAFLWYAVTGWECFTRSSRVALVGICNPPVRCVALEIVGTAVQQVNASRLDVYTTRSLFLVQFVELTYLRTFSFLVIMWLACSETNAEDFLGQCSQTPPGHGQPHRILCQCSCCEDTASFAVFWVRWGGIYS